MTKLVSASACQQSNQLDLFFWNNYAQTRATEDRKWVFKSHRNCQAAAAVARFTMAWLLEDPAIHPSIHLSKPGPALMNEYVIDSWCIHWIGLPLDGFFGRFGTVRLLIRSDRFVDPFRRRLWRRWFCSLFSFFLRTYSFRFFLSFFLAARLLLHQANINSFVTWWPGRCVP